MTAPERRRPLPALVFIGALTLLTALVWFRVIHRNDSGASPRPQCSTSTSGTPKLTLPKVVPVAKNVSVAVLNSTNRNGIAASTKKAMTKIGFRVTIATDDAAQYGGHGLIKGTGEIRYGDAALAQATLLHYYLPSATLVPTDTSGTVVTLSLGAKFTSLRTPAQVAASLKAAGRRTTTGAVPTQAASSSASLCAPVSAQNATAAPGSGSGAGSGSGSGSGS